ncbi:phosphotransferase [candidate division KSB1 bacterium]|nr:phosphotransferase [candidate division KSB1 bacterium]
MDKIVNLNSSQPLAFDTHWLKENLPRYLWRENEIAGAVVQLEILYIGESSKRVVVLYQIEVQDLAHATRRQMYVGYIVPADQLAAEHEKMAAKAQIQPPCGRAVVLVPEAAMILVAFPNDQKLHLLTEAKLQPWLATHLHEVANGSLDGMAWQVQEAKTEILRYVPDKRCTTRCRIKIKAATGLAKEISFVAKQLADTEKAKRQYDDLVAMRQAWSGNGVAAPAVNAESKLPVRLPQALAWDENNATVFIEEISGKNLQHALAGIDLARVMPAVGGMLAHFHRAHQRVKKSVSRAGELAEIHDVVQTVAAAFPVLQPRLQRLFDRLESAQWGDSPAVLLHGTFRLNHIFIDGDALALIDFDSLRMGHPAYDLANFLSSLYYLEAQERLEPSRRENIARHFLAGYAAKAPLPVPPEMLLWFLADLLIKKQTHKYVKHFHKDRAQKVERMLALAEITLAGCRNAPAEPSLATMWKLLP